MECVCGGGGGCGQGGEEVLFPWFQDDESSPTTETYEPMLPCCDLAISVAAGNPDQLYPPGLKLGPGDTKMGGPMAVLPQQR